MLAGGEARGRIHIVCEVRNTKDDGIGRFFGVNSRAAFHSAFAKRSRKSQYASQSPYFVLLFG